MTRRNNPTQGHNMILYQPTPDYMHYMPANNMQMAMFQHYMYPNALQSMFLNQSMDIMGNDINDMEQIKDPSSMGDSNM